MNEIKFSKRYVSATVGLLTVLLSLNAVSAQAKSQKKTKHRHNTVVVHEVYLFNPRPVVNQNGSIVHNRIEFTPQPIIHVPAPTSTQRCYK